MHSGIFTFFFQNKNNGFVHYFHIRRRTFEKCSTMVEPQTAVFVLALFFLRYSSCTEKCLRFRRLSLTPSRFAEKFTAIGGISLSECAERGTNEDVLGINYQANTRECELIKRAGGCIEYENGNITGWQAYRSCDIETAGTILSSCEHALSFIPLYTPLL